MIIPTFNYIKEKVKHLENGNQPVEIGGAIVFYTFTELDPLEKFIYNNEPAGKLDKEWREDLQLMINFVKGTK